MLLSSIYPLGVYFQGVEGTALTWGRAWSPSSLLTVGRGQWEAEGKHRSATGPGGGDGESAAVGLAQCLGDGQADTGPAVVPTAGGTPGRSVQRCVQAGQLGCPRRHWRRGWARWTPPVGGH